MSSWVSLAPYFDELEAFANLILEKKKSYSSFRPWNTSNPSLAGLCGEKAFALAAHCEMNMEYVQGGDDGYDFVFEKGTIDIKTSTRDSEDTYLLHPVKSERWADYYVLCIVDLDFQEAKVAGYCTKEQLQQAPIRNLGYLDNYGLKVSELKPIEDLLEWYEGFRAAIIGEVIKRDKNGKITFHYADQPDESPEVTGNLPEAPVLYVEQPPDELTTLDSLQRFWPIYCERMNSRFSGFSKYFARAIPLSWENDTLTLEFTNEWHYECAKEAMQRIDLKGLIASSLDNYNLEVALKFETW
jgi:hypothetical protein